MADKPKPLFSFDEQDHLTRIHLKLGLENLGFLVEEDGDDLSLVGATSTGEPLRRDR